jgi:hypothetical protein
LDRTALKKLLVSQGTFASFDADGDGKLSVEEVFQGTDADESRKITMQEFVEGYGGSMALIQGKPMTAPPVNGGAEGAEREKAHTTIAKPRLGTTSKWKNMFEKLSVDTPEPALARRGVSPQPRSPSPVADNDTAEAVSPIATPPDAASVSVAPAVPPQPIDSDDPPYLYRDIDRVTAEAILEAASAGEGDYLVRAKNEDRLEYVLTVMYTGKPTHHAIAQGPDGALVINRQACGTARSLHAVVAFLSDSPPSWPVPLRTGVDRAVYPPTSGAAEPLRPPVDGAEGAAESQEEKAEPGKLATATAEAPAIAVDEQSSDALGEDMFAKFGGGRKRSNFSREKRDAGPNGKLTIRSKAKSFLTGEAVTAAAKAAEQGEAVRSAKDGPAEALKKQQRAARRAHTEALHQKKLEQTRNNE